jgi:hypothetical protein
MSRIGDNMNCRATFILYHTLSLYCTRFYTEFGRKTRHIYVYTNLETFRLPCRYSNQRWFYEQRRKLAMRKSTIKLN